MEQGRTKTVAPTFTEQRIKPDANYAYISKITVTKIPVDITDNSHGGKTVTIG